MARSLLDNNGNVLRGVRSPQVDAPIATLSGVGNSGATGTSAAFCGLFGRTLPFSASQLAGLTQPTSSSSSSPMRRH